MQKFRQVSHIFKSYLRDGKTVSKATEKNDIHLSQKLTEIIETDYNCLKLTLFMTLRVLNIGNRAYEDINC